MPTTGTATAHQDLIKLTSNLERLKAQREILEEEIEHDIIQLKDKWEIEDIDSALASIKNIQATAQEATGKRDAAIESAEQIMARFTKE